MALPAFAATTSDSRITISGGPIAGETFVFPRLYGDWFVTPRDAHAFLTLVTTTGAHQAQAEIELDGKSDRQVVKAGAKDLNFYLHLKAPYNQTAQLKGSDAIEITLTRMDDLNIEASVSGTATLGENAAVKIGGTLKIHRDAANAPVGGAFGDCDPVVHDRLAGAEWRSATECEIKFDTQVREALRNALKPLESGLGGDWEETARPKTDAIYSIPRQSEKAPFQLEQAVRLEFRLRSGSAQAQRNQAAIDAVTKHMADAMKSVEAAKAFESELTVATHAAEASGHIAVSVRINLPSLGIENFKGTHTDAQIPGVGYSIGVPYVQARTGGDIGASHQTTYVLLGGWSPATGVKSGEGERINTRSNLGPRGANLTVQNIEVEIEAGPELAKQAIGLIDWNAMRQLLAGK